jgi:hypothetical protein
MQEVEAEKREESEARKWTFLTHGLMREQWDKWFGKKEICGRVRQSNFTSDWHHSAFGICSTLS